MMVYIEERSGGRRRQVFIYLEKLRTELAGVES